MIDRPVIDKGVLDDLRWEVEERVGELPDELRAGLLAALDLAEVGLRMRWPADGQDLLDPRQRRAAAALLCAIDLPVPAEAWARQVTVAAYIAPGLKTGDITIGSRAAGLRLAQALIHQMLVEIDG